MADFGRQLKEAREQQGVSLRQIATATKISVTALEALERNDFSRLPGGIFSRAFVRAYAIQVGLDPEQTVQDFLIEYELNDNAAAEKAPPEVTADDRAFLERQRRAAWWLRAGSVALVLGLMAVLIAWQVRRAKSALDRQVDSRPSQAASAPPAPVVETPVPNAVGSPAPSPEAKPPEAKPTNVRPSDAKPPEARTPEAGPPGATSATSRGSAAPAPVADEEVTLRVEATADCWTRVTVDGAVLFEQILKAGDTRDIKPGRDVYLQVGDASAVKWSINGQSAKAMGTPGQPAEVRVSRATAAKYLQ